MPKTKGIGGARVITRNLGALILCSIMLAVFVFAFYINVPDWR